jgi:CDP-glucose 4,6-dehydratase
MKNFWKNKKIFITGHTGFKGSWLSIYLNFLGAEITGYSLKPERVSLFNLAKVSLLLKKNYYANIQDYTLLNRAIIDSKAEIIFHLAAQSLVSESYKNPFNTFTTNVTGTINVIESISHNSKIKAALLITTDKVYDTSVNKIFKETDKLGGIDPYSASKVCCEYVIQSYIKSVKKLAKKNNICIARAGNVIGGGDYSKDRLIPDIYKSVKDKKNLILRNPDHVRPWQHVLEPLNGYLKLVERIYNKKKLYQKVWNFGPHLKNCKSVNEVTLLFKKYLKFNFKIIKNKTFIENPLLRLNNAKTTKYLNWQHKWDIKKTISKIIDWNNYGNKKDMIKICEQQINQYIND